MDINLRNAIKSTYIHHAVAKDIISLLKCDISLQEIVYNIESKIIEKGGSIAFPVGLGINECVAHFTPDPLGEPILLKNNDLLKIDFGVHMDGIICDCAFTVGIGDNNIHNDIINISKNATKIGILKSGVDVRLKEIGEAIEEYVMSKEVIYDNNIMSLCTMRDLCGHSMSPYTIHSGKAVPNTKISFPYDVKMKEGEFYAIEPFVTTGKGDSIYYPDSVVSHFSFKNISNYNSNVRKLPFSRYWEDFKEIDLTKNTNEYPPIYDIKGSFVAQHEENIYIASHRVIQLTKSSSIIN